VCAIIRTHHIFGRSIHLLLGAALLEMRLAVRIAADLLADRLGVPKMTPHALEASDVTFLDVGAHVGSVGLDMWNMGFNTRYVEGLDRNVWLIHYTMCINRKAGAAAAGQAGMAEQKPALSLTFAGLGASPGECVILSLKVNVCDGTFYCDPYNVSLGRAYVQHIGSVWLPEPIFVVRGFVEIQTLDAVVFGHSRSIESAPLSGGWAHVNDRAVAYFHEAYAAHRRAMGEAAASAPPPSSTQQAIEQMTTPQLLSFLRYQQYIMKIDIEGGEIRVFQCAPRFLSSPALRPKVILSEMWLALHWTTFGEIMFGNGYTAFCIQRQLKAYPTLPALLAGQLPEKTEIMVEVGWVHLMNAMGAAVGRPKVV
jgi:hypothetical protein